MQSHFTRTKLTFISKNVNFQAGCGDVCSIGVARKEMQNKGKSALITRYGLKSLFMNVDFALMLQVGGKCGFFKWYDEEYEAWHLTQTCHVEQKKKMMKRHCQKLLQDCLLAFIFGYYVDNSGFEDVVVLQFNGVMYSCNERMFGQNFDGYKLNRIHNRFQVFP